MYEIIYENVLQKNITISEEQKTSDWKPMLNEECVTTKDNYRYRPNCWDWGRNIKKKNHIIV